MMDYKLSTKTDTTTLSTPTSETVLRQEARQSIVEGLDIPSSTL
jgi:hypothetical protein